jgi:hypothetical protein
VSESNVTSPTTSRHEPGRLLIPLSLIALIPPVLVGLALRAVGLRGQILTGDELHSVHGALAMPVSQILRTWTFGDADYCVPLTASYRWLMDQGVVFSEVGFRLPSLLAGVAAIALLPWLAAPRLGRRGAIAFAWLLAVSPMLVFYSRIVRSYMPAVLAAGIAIALFDRWRQRRRGIDAIGYVLSGAAAVYLHLGAAPLVLAPLVHAALRAAPQPRRIQEWTGLLWPALAIGITIGALLLPAQESLLEVLRDKRDGDLPSLATWIGVLRLQLGTRDWIIGLLALALLFRGGFELWRTQPDFLGYLATLLAAQVIGLLLLAPDRMQERAILNRYLLVSLPILLAFVSVGLATPWTERQVAPHTEAATPGFDWGTTLISTVALVSLYVTGPLAPNSYYWSSSFTNALTSVDFLGDGNWIAPPATPRFYRSLAESDSDETVIEYPWQNMSSHVFDAYQHVHGLDVIVSSVIDRADDRRLALRNRAEPTPEGFLSSRARYLIVHIDLLAEAGRVTSSDIHLRKWLRAKKELWLPLRRAGTAMSSELERRWGAPIYRDAALRVWDLEVVRARSRSPEAS